MDPGTKQKRRRRRSRKKRYRYLTLALIVVGLLVGLKLKREYNAQIALQTAPQAASSMPVEDKDLTITPDAAEPSSAMGLTAPLPTHMKFSSLSLSNGYSGRFARDEKTGIALALLSTPQNLSPEQLMNMLRAQEINPEVPNLKGVMTDSFSQLRKIEAVRDSGLGAALLWSGKNRQDEQVHMAYAPRLDMKGVYIVLMTSDKDRFEKSDEYVEYLYRNMRVDTTSH